MTSRQYLTARQVAEKTGFKLQTVYNWRTTGQGPKGQRLAGSLRYAIEDVDEWIEANLEPA